MTRKNGTIPVVCAVIEKDGLFLAAQRGPGQPHAGAWELPGGKIQTGETPEDAIVREIQEELGVGITVRCRLDEVTFSYPDKTITLIPFVCGIDKDDFSMREHQDIRWVDKEGAQGIEWLPPDREILDNYLKSGPVIFSV
jgi:8-oxo-dGTP diphosphatase